ncbi:MAG: hypothetical protein J1G05_02260 [Clostridiales bacterium]|nr:hypothetical protein [Clostridiales bacterium]
MLLCFGAAIIIFPERYINCCFQGFAMWAQCVLPSLFPFMIITLIFTKTGMADKASLPLKGVMQKVKLPPSAGACFLMSVCSGYPAGSRIVSEFYSGGLIERRDTPKLAYLCSSSGPLFILGSVGVKMFKNKGVGLKILAAHILSILVVAIIISVVSKKSAPSSAERKPYKGNVLYDVFYGAVISVAVAGGFIAFFYVLSRFVADFKLLYPVQLLFNLFCDEQTSEAVCTGLIEATSGCSALSLCQSYLSVPLAGFLITFGGVSILCQQLCYLVGIGVKPLKFIGVKALQAVLCFVLLLLLNFF